MSVSVDNSQERYMEIVRQRREEIRRAEEQRRVEEQQKVEEEKSIFDFEKDDNSVNDKEKYDNSILGGNYEDSAGDVTAVGKAKPVDALQSTGSQRTSDSTDLDGNIDASSQSETTGDCWLLTGLNSMSYSEAGRQAIKDAMTFNDDGSVTVNFKGVGASYTVSAKQIEAANQTTLYSSGDDDVLVYEMAYAQLRHDINIGKIKFNLFAPSYLSDSGKSMDMGYAEQVWYMLTGKLSQKTSNPSEVNKYLDKFEQNPDTTAMSCSFKGGEGDRNGFTVKDTNGNPLQLQYSHAYAVKSVDDDKVTIVNPWDSTQKIVLDRNTFAQFAILKHCDLSDNNKDKSGAFSKIVA